MIFLAAAVPSPSPAGSGPLLAGHFPEGAFPRRERVIADIWDFVKTLGAARADLSLPGDCSQALKNPLVTR